MLIFEEENNNSTALQFKSLSNAIIRFRNYLTAHQETFHNEVIPNMNRHDFNACKFR